MSDLFDLEQQILETWKVTDDINLLYANVMDKDMSKDDIANTLLGIRHVYNMRYEQMWETFERMTKEFYEAKKHARV